MQSTQEKEELEKLRFEHKVFLRDLQEAVSSSSVRIAGIIEDLLNGLPANIIAKISGQMLKLIEEYRKIETYRCFLTAEIYRYPYDLKIECLGKVAEEVKKYREKVFETIQEQQL